MLRTTNVDFRIGVDIGGTKMSAVLLAGEKVIGEYTLATPTDDLNKFMVMLGALVDPLLEQVKKAKGKILGIGIGVPAALSGGKVILAPNVSCLNGVKIVELLTEKFENQYLVKVDNDANCFVLGEALLGAGKKSSNVYGMIIGTGIGGGWYNDKVIYTGGHGAANEPGQTVIDYRENITLEAAYHQLTQNNPRVLAEEANQGDELANRIFNELGQLLGVGISNVINMLDPEVVVIGGGAVESSELFFKEIKETVKKLTVGANTKIMISKLGKQAGAIGAAQMI